MNFSGAVYRNAVKFTYIAYNLMLAALELKGIANVD